MGLSLAASVVNVGKGLAVQAEQQGLALHCTFWEPQIPGKVRKKAGCWEGRSRILMCLVPKLEFQFVCSPMPWTVFQVRKQSGQRALDHFAVHISLGPPGKLLSTLSPSTRPALDAFPGWLTFCLKSPVLLLDTAYT